MDARPTAEQDVLRGVVTALGRNHAAATVHELGEPDRARRMTSLLGEAGLYGLRDGSGSTPAGSGVDVAIVAEELSFAAAEAPFGGRILAAELMRLAGLPPPTETVTIALEVDLRMLARRGPDEPFGAGVAFDAAGASAALLLCGDASGIGLASVPIADITIATDLTRPIGKPHPGAIPQAIAPPGSLHERDVAAWRTLAHATLAADLLGSMRAAHAATLAYARVRSQYGRPIASFQAVQHLLADSLVRLEGATSAVRYAAWAVDAGDEAQTRDACRIAKAYCAEAAREVCEMAIQVHGGIGNTWECMVHVYLRRALHSIDVLGSDSALLEELAGERVGGGSGLPR